MAEHSAEDVAQIPISTIVTFAQTIIGVEKTPEQRVLTIIDPMSGTQYMLPLNLDAANKLAIDLVGGLQIAQELPDGSDFSARDN